jgi:uncharacterized phage-like protein YoqJ
MAFDDQVIETGIRVDIGTGDQGDRRQGQDTQPLSRTALAFTGHRPQRLGGFNPHNPTACWVRKQLAAAIERAVRAGFRTFIAGGALGFDYWAACAVLDQQQHLILALPFAGHDRRWPTQRRTELAVLMERAQAIGGEIHYVSAPPYSPEKLIIRDHWMIDRAQAISAGWDGGQYGGTWRAITYARTVQRPTFPINPTTRTAGWL